MEGRRAGPLGLLEAAAVGQYRHVANRRAKSRSSALRYRFASSWRSGRILPYLSSESAGVSARCARREKSWTARSASGLSFSPPGGSNLCALLRFSGDPSIFSLEGSIPGSCARTADGLAVSESSTRLRLYAAEGEASIGPFGGRKQDLARKRLGDLVTRETASSVAEVGSAVVGVDRAAAFSAATI